MAVQIMHKKQWWYLMYIRALDLEIFGEDPQEYVYPVH
jgi:hypothetical protein